MKESASTEPMASSSFLTHSEPNPAIDINSTTKRNDSHLPHPPSASLPGIRAPLVPEGESAKEKLRAGLDRPVRVILTDERVVQGTLMCYDHLGNMILTRTVDLTERVSSRKPVLLGTVLVPLRATQRIFLARHLTHPQTLTLPLPFVPSPSAKPTSSPTGSYSPSSPGTSEALSGGNCNDVHPPNLNQDLESVPDGQGDGDLANQALSSLRLDSSTHPSDTKSSQPIKSIPH